MPLANNALVLVTDGRKTLFFRNHGDENQIDLRTEAHDEREDLKDREIKSDAAGSSKQSFGYGRPAMEETDFRIFGMDEFYMWPAEDSEYAFHFAGMMKTLRPVVVRRGETQRQVFLTDTSKGDWTSKLFAQAKLTYGRPQSREEILALSMKYQVPSSYTALLAVPKEEWKLFEQKKKEWTWP